MTLRGSFVAAKRCLPTSSLAKGALWLALQFVSLGQQPTGSGCPRPAQSRHSCGDEPVKTIAIFPKRFDNAAVPIVGPGTARDGRRQDPPHSGLEEREDVLNEGWKGKLAGDLIAQLATVFHLTVSGDRIGERGRHGIDDLGLERPQRVRS